MAALYPLPARRTRLVTEPDRIADMGLTSSDGTPLPFAVEYDEPEPPWLAALRSLEWLAETDPDHPVRLGPSRADMTYATFDMPGDVVVSVILLVDWPGGPERVVTLTSVLDAVQQGEYAGDTATLRESRLVATDRAAPHAPPAAVATPQAHAQAVECGVYAVDMMGHSVLGPDADGEMGPLRHATSLVPGLDSAGQEAALQVPNILLAATTWLGVFGHPEDPEEDVYVLRDGDLVALVGNKAVAYAYDPITSPAPRPGYLPDLPVAAPVGATATPGSLLFLAEDDARLEGYAEAHMSRGSVREVTVPASGVPLLDADLVPDPGAAHLFRTALPRDGAAYTLFVEDEEADHPRVLLAVMTRPGAPGYHEHGAMVHGLPLCVRCQADVVEAIVAAGGDVDVADSAGAVPALRLPFGSAFADAVTYAHLGGGVRAVAGPDAAEAPPRPWIPVPDRIEDARVEQVPVTGWLPLSPAGERDPARGPLTVLRVDADEDHPFFARRATPAPLVASGAYHQPGRAGLRLRAAYQDGVELDVVLGVGDPAGLALAGRLAEADLAIVSTGGWPRLQQGRLDLPEGTALLGLDETVLAFAHQARRSAGLPPD